MRILENNFGAFFRVSNEASTPRLSPELNRHNRAGRNRVFPTFRVTGTASISSSGIGPRRLSAISG